MSRIVSWFSCGAASAVAAKITLSNNRDAEIVYCETGAEHSDNERFMRDCIRWFNSPITSIRSEEYTYTWDVWEKTKWLAGIDGARCTGELKFTPRLGFQRIDDVHVFGYTADASDVKRANRLRMNYPEMRIRTPLIEAGVTKEACLAIIAGAGIEIPAMYKLGFQNNNCIPCVKATSPNYWALIRKAFPEQFERMAKLSRELDVRLTRIKGERCFIDEIPLDHPTIDPIAPTCDFLCHLASMGLDGEAA